MPKIIPKVLPLTLGLEDVEGVVLPLTLGLEDVEGVVSAEITI